MKKFEDTFEKIMVNLNLIKPKYPDFICSSSDDISIFFKNLNDISFSNKKYIFNEKPYNLIIENRLVFRSDNFLNIISIIEKMNTIDFRIFSKRNLDFLMMKTYGKWKNENKKLAILKFNFSNRDEFFILIEKIFSKEILSKYKNNFNLIFKQLKTAKGVYFPFSSEIGLMLLNNENLNFNVVKHELIHFIQDVTGNGILKEVTNDDGIEKFISIENLSKNEKLNSFGMSDKEILKHTISNEEIVPYFNNICYVLEKNNVADPLSVINDIIKKFNDLKRNDGKIQDIINYIKTKISLAGISEAEIIIIVICLLYGQHMTLLKKIIGNFFKK